LLDLIRSGLLEWFKRDQKVFIAQNEIKIMGELKEKIINDL
jgi:hypothetical protein